MTTERKSGAAAADPGRAEDLARVLAQAAKKGPPPVHLWNPPFCGDLDIQIRRDGSWWYLGTPIGREPLVRLFASVLRREGDQYFLVTPVEKIGIRVDDAPFVARDFSVAGVGPDQVLTFHTNVGDDTVAGAENPIRVVRDPQTGEPSPYVHVRRGLHALIDRKSFFRLVDIGAHATVGRHDWFGLWSSGQFFPLIPSAEMGDAPPRSD